MSTANDNIPRIVRTLLAHQGKQQADLAAFMNVTPGVISKLLSGRRAVSVDDVVRMADFFDVSPALFFDDPATLVRNRWFLEPALTALAS